ncbi:MAG: single-stranded DNA-binding protein [Burkholderiales bacterium]|nr:single-stranded DNA-binding protein [Burkholderiales bacterium]
MSSLNRVQLIGRLGADPEMTRTQGGLLIAKMRLATSETWRDKQSGEKKEHTDWHTVVCFNENISKIIEQYVKKGSLIMVEGKLETRSWEKDGEKRYATEVKLTGFDAKLILLGAKGDGGGGGGGGGGRDYDREMGDRRGSSNPQPSSGGGRASTNLDDDIPF